MRLTRASSYALHAVLFMASQKIDKPMASHKIAEARKIPERFLLKVLKPLVSARILTSVKGPNGGYRLAKTAAKISVLDIIEIVDGPIRAAVPDWNGGTTAASKQILAIAEDAAADVRKRWGRASIDTLMGTKK
jgi:Rrf2 family protein